MRSAILGFAAGIAWLQMQAQLPSCFVCAGLLTLVALFVWLTWRRRHPLVRVFALSAAGACLGFVWAAALAQHYLEQALPFAWEGRDITLVGTVDSLPYRFEQGVRFHFKVEQVVPQGEEVPVVPARLALAWYAPRTVGMQTTQAHPDEVQPGARWQLTVRLKRPHGNANPEGFDYEVWLLEQKLRATGTVRSDRLLPLKNQLLQDFVWTPGHVIEFCRGWLRERIFAALPQAPYAGVIVALVIGDQRAISQSDWTIFNRTGVGHLVAISGLHISMVAGLFAAAVGFLWRRSFFMRAQLPLMLPTQKVMVLAGMVAALLYVLLAGAGIPAQRTLYMLIVVGVAYWTGRLTHISYVLCLALAVVLLLDPWALLWPGFWLSFGTVAIILYATSGRVIMHDTMMPESMMGQGGKPARLVRWWRTWQAGVRTQYAVTIGLLPLTLLLFGQYSLVSPLANAVAIPLITLLVMPLSLLGSMLPAPLSDGALLLAHTLTAWLAQVLGWLSSLPVAVWRAPLPSAWMFVLALVGTALLLAPRGWPARWLGVFGWLPLLLHSPAAPSPGQMWVTAFDVGQGMALLVETARHRLLYDTGSYYSPQSNAGSRVIVPYLRARGINHLDVVVVSHNDNDHSGGALSIFEEMAVDRVYSSLALNSPIVQAAPDHQRCQAGQH